MHNYKVLGSKNNISLALLMEESASPTINVL